MIDTICTYEGRDDLLIAYLYDDIEPADRAAFSAHLSGCGRCTRELTALRGVRTTLSAWAPPEPMFSHQSAAGSRQSVISGYEPPAYALSATAGKRDTRSWHDVPAWAQVAAAILVLGVSASVANIEVRRDNTGWTLRTGWSSPAPAAPVATESARAAEPATPWRADLTALEQQLRTEIRTMQTRAVPASASISDAELQRRVRAIIDESERRQERELALRVAEVVKDVNAQRQADLVKIDRSLGMIQSSTYGEQMKQRELVNYLLKVSQKQ